MALKKVSRQANSPCSPRQTAGGLASLTKRGTFNLRKTSPSLEKRRGRVGRGDELDDREIVFQHSVGYWNLFGPPKADWILVLGYSPERALFVFPHYTLEGIK